MNCNIEKLSKTIKYYINDNIEISHIIYNACIIKYRLKQLKEENPQQTIEKYIKDLKKSNKTLSELYPYIPNLRNQNITLQINTAIKVLEHNYKNINIKDIKNETDYNRAFTLDIVAKKAPQKIINFNRHIIPIVYDNIYKTVKNKTTQSKTITREIIKHTLNNGKNIRIPNNREILYVKLDYIENDKSSFTYLTHHSIKEFTSFNDNKGLTVGYNIELSKTNNINHIQIVKAIL